MGRPGSTALPRDATSAQKTAKAAPPANGSQNARERTHEPVTNSDTASTPTAKKGPRSRTVSSSAADIPAAGQCLRSTAT